MEILILELVWWGLLFLFFWGLRGARGQLEADIEAGTQLHRSGETRNRNAFQQPQQVREPIGSYQGAPIYHYAELNGKIYRFDRVCPPDIADSIECDELYIAPGLVYQACAAR